MAGEWGGDVGPAVMDSEPGEGACQGAGDNVSPHCLCAAGKLSLQLLRAVAGASQDHSTDPGETVVVRAGSDTGQKDSQVWVP